MRCATIAVLVAGFTRTGIPARSAQAAFSPRPHAGKLNALTCTATPSRGTRTCCPKRRALRPSWHAVAVDEDRARRRAPPRGRRRPRGCRSRRRRRTSRPIACCRRSRWRWRGARRAWRGSRGTSRGGARRAARNVSARRAGPPRSRAKASAGPKSTPPLDTSARGASVAGLSRVTGAEEPPPFVHCPPT